MLNLRLGEPPPNGGGSGPYVAAIGNFDGVHAGHRYLLQQVIGSARRQGLGSLAVVFWPNPRAVLQPERWPGYLSTEVERHVLLQACGLDALLTLPFDRTFAALTPVEFVQRLAATAQLAELWVGEDFRFGHRRSGDVALLRELGAPHGIRVMTIPRQDLPDGEIGSTRIRDALRAGDAELAARLLSRPYRLGGSVVHGDQRGRTLGFPTANLTPDADKIMPGRGIYAAVARVNDIVRPAAVSIGIRPQFDGAIELVEAYLLDFSGDLYDRRIELDFLTKLRDEQRFESVDALASQMNRDVEQVRAHSIGR